MASALVILGVSAVARAQTVGDVLGKESVTNRPVFLLAALAALSLVPLLVIMVTSFVKISVVLALVRQAIGTQQIPPTMVLTGIAMMLSVYVMSPVVLEVYHRGQDRILERGIRELTLKAIEPVLATELVNLAQQPVRDFLIRHAQPVELDFFTRIARKIRRGPDADAVTREDFMVILPAFVMSELKEAFIIGFVIFMPLLAIDMVVGNVLMALGMQMLSPTTISLPFKVLLFVVVDGWHLLTKGLVLSYM